MPLDVILRASGWPRIGICNSVNSTQPKARMRKKYTPLTPNHGTAISTPASDGPMTRLAFMPALLSASALVRSCRGTSCGIHDCRVGIITAKLMP